MRMKLRELKGLGLKTEQQLIEVGIHNAEQLREVGAVEAYLRLKNKSDVNPSLNFLYALVGAIEDRHWLNIAQNEKMQLLMELEGYAELGRILEEGDYR